jgi:hypothetical protein
METNTVLPRVERLERQNRRLRLAALLFVVLMVGVGAAQKLESSKTLTANRIELVDGDGKIRLVADAASGKGVGLTFQNEQGETRLRIGVVGKDARVETWDENKRQWRNFVAPIGVIPAK